MNIETPHDDATRQKAARQAARGLRSLVNKQRREEVSFTALEFPPEIDRDALRKRLLDSEPQVRGRIAELEKELAGIMRRADPVQLISQIGFVSALGVAGDDDMADTFGLDAMLDGLIDSALTIALPLSEVPPAPEDLTMAIAALRDLQQLQVLARSIRSASRAAGGSPDTVDEASDLLVFEEAINRTQGFTQHIEQIAAAVLEPLRGDCVSAVGFAPADLPKVAAALTRHRANQLYLEIERARLDGNNDYFLEGLRHASTRNEVLETPASLAAIAGLPEVEIASMVSALSVPWGGRVSHSPQGRTLNPTAMCIDMGGGNYFLPQPWALSHDLFTWYDDYLKRSGNDQLRSKYLRRRDTATEKLAGAALREVFGDDRVAARARYASAEGEAEVDAVVDLGTAAIVVECKAASVTASARRGGSGRVKAKLGELVTAPLAQANRAAAYIASGGREFRPTGRDKFVLGEVDAVLKVTVSFERISPLAYVASEHASAAGVDAAWVICLADLLAVVELLPDPSMLATYIKVRCDLAREPRLKALMEMDLVSQFIVNRLTPIRRELGTSDNDLHISYFASPANEYFSCRQAGVDVPLPDHGLPSAVLGGLRLLFERRDRSWLPMALHLVDRNPLDWQAFGNVERKAKKTARKGRIGRRRLDLDDPSVSVEVICAESEIADDPEPSGPGPGVVVVMNAAGDVTGCVARLGDLEGR